LKVGRKKDLDALRKELAAAKKELDVTLQQLDTVKKALQAEIAEIHAMCIDATARADNEEALKKHWIAEKHTSDDIVISKDKEIGHVCVCVCVCVCL